MGPPHLVASYVKTTETAGLSSPAIDHCGLTKLFLVQSVSNKDKDDKKYSVKLVGGWQGEDGRM